MGVPFDHAQYALDSSMVLGASSSDIDRTGTFADEEFWRSYVNPGFEGTFDFMEVNLAFNGYTDGGAVTVTYKWEIRPHGQSNWVNIFTSSAAAWPTNQARQAKLVFEPSSGTEDDVPLELRLLITTSGSDTVHVSIGNTACSLRVVGESL